MKKQWRLFFSVLAFVLTGVAADEAQVPISAFLRANRPCTIGSYDLTKSGQANNGETWYGSSRFILSNVKTLTADIDGYTTEWYSYKYDLSTLRDDGPSAATKLLASGSTIVISSVLNNLRKSAAGYGLLYVVLTPITYMVSFDLNGATDSRPTQSVDYDEEFSVVAPEREGYTFAGWSYNGTTYAPGAKISKLTTKEGAQVTLTAIWTAKTYYLQLNIDNTVAKIYYKIATGDWQETTTSKSVAVEYDQPWQAYLDSAYGYTYSGLGGSKSSPMSSTMTVAGAEFPAGTSSKNSYKITVTAEPAAGCANLVGGGDSSCAYLTELTLQASAQKGYKFVGWSDGTTDNPYKLQVIQDKALVARFEEESETPGSCSVTFYANDGSGKKSEQELTKGVDASLTVNSFSRTGYTFAGWSEFESGAKKYDDQECVNFDQNKNLYAVWTPNTYEVIFDANGGSGNMPAQILIYGAEKTIACTLTKPDGASGFLGWGTNTTVAITGSDGKLSLNLSAIKNDHMRLYAIWKYEVGSWSEWLGCNNLEWKNQGDQDNIDWDKKTDDEGNYICNENDIFWSDLYRKEIPSDGTLSFQWKKKDTGELVVIVGSKTNTCDAITWASCTNQVSKGENITFTGYNGAYIRNVRWERKIDGKTVTFNLNGGTRIGGGALTQTVESGHAALSPTVQAPAGYALKGWDKNFDSVTEGLTVTAQYSNTYSRIVYVNTLGATNPNQSTYTVDDELTFEALANDKFAAWSPTGIVKGTSGTLVVTAQWQGGAASTTNVVTMTNGIDDGSIAVRTGNSVMAKAAKTKIINSKSYACTSWTGTGDIESGTVDTTVPVDGSGNLVIERTITCESSITWNYTEIKNSESGSDSGSGSGSDSGSGSGSDTPSVDPTPVAPTIDLGLAIDAWEFSADVTTREGVAYQGVYVLWPVAVADGATVKVASLPSGLKYATKDTKDTKRGITISAGTIYGAPSAAKTVTTKFTVANGKAKQIYELKLTVKAVATDLIGSYVGGSMTDPMGSATVKLAKTGKVSGKWISEGKTWNLSSLSFDDYDAEDEIYTVTMTAKCGKETDTLEARFGVQEVAAGMTHGVGTVSWMGCSIFDAVYVNWKAAPWKTLATKFKNKTFVHVQKGVALTGKVGSSGVVKVAGAFDIGATKPYKATVKGSLIPLGCDRFKLFLDYPAKKNKFDGFIIPLVLEWDGETFSLVE